MIRKVVCAHKKYMAYSKWQHGGKYYDIPYIRLCLLHLPINASCSLLKAWQTFCSRVSLNSAKMTCLFFSLLSAHFSFTLNDRNAGKRASGPPEAVCSAVTLCQPHLSMRSVCLSAQFQEESLGMVNAVLEKSCPCKDIVCLSASKIKKWMQCVGVKKIYILTIGVSRIIWFFAKNVKF